VNGYSWHAKPAHYPSHPSIQTPVALSSAPDVVITLRGKQNTLEVIANFYFLIETSLWQKI